MICLFYYLFMFLREIVFNKFYYFFSSFDLIDHFVPNEYSLKFLEILTFDIIPVHIQLLKIEV